MITKWISLLRTGQSAIGLEITDTFVKMVELSLSGKTTLLKASSMEKLPKGAVEEGKILDVPRVILTLQQMISRVKWKTKKAHLALPSSLVMVRYLKLPDLPLKELSKVVEFEIKHNIHLPFEEPLYDFIKMNGTNDAAPRRRRKLKPASGTDGLAEVAVSQLPDMFGDFETEKKEDASSQCDVMLVAAPKELVDEYTRLIESAGLVPISMEIKAFSLFRLVETFQPIDPKATFLMVDVNASASDLTICHEGQLKLTRSVTVDFSDKSAQSGDNNLVFFQYAEPDSVFQSGLGELGHEIERLLNFYRYSLNHRNQQFEWMLLTGDVDRLDEIARYLGDRLNMRVHRLGASDLDISDMLDTETTSIAVPIGLALRGNRR